MMQSPEAQYQLALKMPMNRLMGILQGKPDAVVGQPIAMLALQSLKEQKTAAQGMQAQQQLQQPNVKDQLLAEDQGIAVASAPNMNAVVNAAHGGIVGYDSGGAVQHFQSGAPVRTTSGGQSWFLDLPETIRDPSVPFYRGIPNPVYQRLGNSQFPTKQAAEDAYQAISGARGDVLTGVSDFDKAYPAIPPVPAATNRVPSTQGEPESKYTAPRLRPQDTSRPRVQGAPVPDPNFITQLDTAPQASPAMPAAQRPQQAQYERPDWLNTMDRFSGSQKYSDEMTETLKQLTDTAEEKSSKKDTALATTFLKAARAAFQPGKTNSGALGDIFGEIADGAEKYKKEEAADKKAMAGAKLSMLGVQAQLLQNNEKAAGDQYRHGETLALQAGQYAYDNAFKQKELELKDRQISDEAKYRMATVAGEAAKLAVTEKWYTMHGPLLSAQAKYYGNRGTGGVTPKMYLDAGKAATTSVDKILSSSTEARKYTNAPEFKGMSQAAIRDELIRRETATNMSRLSGGSSGAQEERSSFQRDDRRPGTTLAELP